MQPDRIVIGAQSEHAVDLMKKVYEPFMAPILVTDINSAELIKHAANSFLALKISYINAVSAICEASGADIEKVADGIGMDKRIGRSFLNAGIGYGGRFHHHLRSTRCALHPFEGSAADQRRSKESVS
jgi:UDPglucose 6-dehydrogenase